MIINKEIFTFVDISAVGNELSFQTVKTDPFVLALDVLDKDGKPLPRAYWKEVAYVGDFVKNGQRFKLTEPLLKHAATVGKEMIADGIEIPMPLGHTKDADKRRAATRDYKTAINSKGKFALYALAQFKDEQSEKDLKDANVSIFMEQNFVSGTGKRYQLPITHIAFTDYPILPGLEPFKPIAASFIDSDLALSLETFTMPITLAELLKKRTSLKINASGKPEEVIAELCDSLDLTLTALDDAKKVVPALSHEPAPAVLVKMVAKDRNRDLEELAKSGSISAAVKDKLSKLFAGDKLALSLSHDGESQDCFDELLSILKENPKAVQLGHTQALPKETEGEGETSAVAKAAQKMADRAKR